MFKREFLFCLLAIIGISNSASSQIKAFAEPSLFSWISLDQAVASARLKGKMVLVLFKSKDCPYCKKMELEIFSKPSFQKQIKRYFIPSCLDLESDEHFLYKGKIVSVQQLARLFKVTGTPTIAFLNDDGDLVAFQPGYINPKIFKELIDFVGTGKYATLTFDEFRAQE